MPRLPEGSSREPLFCFSVPLNEKSRFRGLRK
jgi:hypothetical protein